MKFRHSSKKRLHRANNNICDAATAGDTRPYYERSKSINSGRKLATNKYKSDSSSIFHLASNKGRKSRSNSSDSCSSSSSSGGRKNSRIRKRKVSEGKDFKSHPNIEVELHKDYNQLKKTVNKTVRHMSELVSLLSHTRLPENATSCGANKPTGVGNVRPIEPRPKSETRSTQRIQMKKGNSQNAGDAFSNNSSSSSSSSSSSNRNKAAGSSIRSPSVEFLWLDTNKKKYKSIPALVICCKRVRQLHLQVIYFRVCGEDFILLEKNCNNDGLAFMDVDSRVAFDGLNIEKVLQLQRLGCQLKEQQLSRDYAIQRGASRFFVVPVRLRKRQWHHVQDAHRMLSFVRHLAQQQLMLNICHVH